MLPSFLMVVAIGAVYSAYGGIAWMQAVFYGVGAAVIGIIAVGVNMVIITSGIDLSSGSVVAVAARMTSPRAVVRMSRLFPPRSMPSSITPAPHPSSVAS